MSNENHTGPQTGPQTGPLAAIISLTRQLTQIITEENRLLETRRPRDAAQLHEEKGRLNEAYNREIRTLQQNGGIANITDAPMLRQLKQETRTFREALDKHKRILVRLRTVTESMVKAIGDEVARQNNPVQNYGMNAALTRNTSARPTSLALNQII